LAACGDSAVQEKLAEILKLRNEKAAVPVLMKIWPVAEKGPRKAALAALGAMGGLEQLPDLVKGLVANADGAVAGELENAVRSILIRQSEPDQAAAPIIAGLALAAGPSRESLLRLLEQAQGPAALSALRQALTSTDVPCRKAAVNVLANWKDDAPVSDLRKTAEQEQDKTTRILALRSLIRFYANSKQFTNEQRAERLKEAFGLSDRVEEKKLIIAAMPLAACEGAMVFVRDLQRDELLKDEATMALMKMDHRWFNALLATIKTSAVSGQDMIGNALDGDPRTRWGTKRSMQAGDWFMLDFGRERVLKLVRRRIFRAALMCWFQKTRRIGPRCRASLRTRNRYSR
jgi:hypothetical protein